MSRLLFGFLSVCCASLPGQMLVVDRGIPAGRPVAGPRLARTDGPGFIGDHFQVGGRGEVWVIDSIRVWAADHDGSLPPGAFPERSRKVALFGGIEAPAPQPGVAPQPECDCHNPIAIKSAELGGAMSSSSSEVQISNASNGLWQIDFRNLRWSVPGGVSLQFGVLGTDTWYAQAADTGTVHELKVFDEKGAFQGLYKPNGARLDEKVGLNVQVWAHRMAPVKVHAVGEDLEVVLGSDTSFDATKAEVSTVRFGPNKAAPFAHRMEAVEGRPALVTRFHRADPGIAAGVVSACLTGRQLDGVPFEGCDLLPGK